MDDEVRTRLEELQQHIDVLTQSQEETRQAVHVLLRALGMARGATIYYGYMRVIR